MRRSLNASRGSTLSGLRFDQNGRARSAHLRERRRLFSVCVSRARGDRERLYCEQVRVCVEHCANADVEEQATIDVFVTRDTTVCCTPAARTNGPTICPGAIVPRLTLSIRTSNAFRS